MFRKVLVPVDLSSKEDARTLLESARSLTASWDCELHVITVIPHVGAAIVGSYFDKDFETESRAEASKELASAVADVGLTAQQDVLFGKTYDCIISKADAVGADLIIIGAHQSELGKYLLGSNAARVVRHSTQSVLVIRDGT